MLRNRDECVSLHGMKFGSQQKQISPTFLPIRSIRRASKGGRGRRARGEMTSARATAQKEKHRKLFQIRSRKNFTSHDLCGFQLYRAPFVLFCLVMILIKVSRIYLQEALFILPLNPLSSAERLASQFQFSFRSFHSGPRPANVIKLRRLKRAHSAGYGKSSLT